MAAPEITGRVALTRDDGLLNTAAVGWGRRPFADTSGLGAGSGRNKRWEYWNIATPTHIAALTVSSLDYAGVLEVWVLDRGTGRTWGRTATVPFARGVELAPTLEGGPARARARGLEIDIDEVPAAADRQRGTRLRASIAGAEIDVVAELPVGHERLAVVVPWSPTRFQYTVKDVARPATGRLVLDGREVAVPAGRSWAVLDHGRGRWPYDVTWNWGAGSGVSGGRVIGLQVGGRWTIGTGSTENGVVIDGRLHPILRELEWDYDRADPAAPWRVSGGRLEAALQPFHVKTTRTSLGIVSNRTQQAFGTWSGTFERARGDVVAFDGIVGWAEEVRNRW